MRLLIVARGKIGRGPEAELTERYLGRIAWPTRIVELAERATFPPPGPGSITVALDESGEDMRSVGFAERLQAYRDRGAGEVRFLIGGADGLGVQDRAAAELCLSFGRATWPHLLVRAMLAEQLYRATSILAGHPYHREG